MPDRGLDLDRFLALPGRAIHALGKRKRDGERLCTPDADKDDEDEPPAEHEHQSEHQSKADLEPDSEPDNDEYPVVSDDEGRPDILEGNTVWTEQLAEQNADIEEAEAPVLQEAEEAEAPGDAETVPEPTIAWKPPTSKHPMSPFLFAFAVWCDRVNISRPDYAALLEVIHLARDNPDVWKHLPNTLDTLQNHYQAQIPAPPIYECKIDLRLDKMPTGQSGAGKAYFFDPIELTQTILRSKMRQHMHFGMAQLVEEASELWHGEAWAESIRTCSGVFARYPDGSPIFPSDFVTYRESNMLHAGRVRCIYQDMRTAPTAGAPTAGAPTTGAPTTPNIVVYLEPVMGYVDLADDIKPLVTHPPPHPGECFLIEDIRLISANQIFARLGENVTFDRDFRDDRDLAEEAELLGSQEAAREGARLARQAARQNAGMRVNQAQAPNQRQAPNHGMPPPPPPNQAFNPTALINIRRVINLSKRSIRAVRLTHPVRAELEIKAYGVYMIPSNLPIRERTRLVNVFPLTLGPHGSDLRDVLGCLETPSKKLESGVIMQIPYGESEALVEAFVSSFALGYLGDMPQQNECAGFLRQNAAFGCRSCLIPSKEYGNLDYDITKRGRYHHVTLDIRTKASDMPPTRRKAHLRALGINELPSPVLTSLAPAIDVCRSFPPDPPHAEMSGIGRLLQDLLIDNLLLPNQREAYASVFRKQALPPGWCRVQNPLRHRNSWDLSEQSRACVITAMVLRTWLTNQRLQPALLRAIRAEYDAELSPDLRLKECDIVTRVYSQLASSYTLITKHCLSADNVQNMSSSTLICRSLSLRLINCAISAGTRGRGGVASRASSSGASPAPINEDDDISEPGSQLGGAQPPKASANVLGGWLNRPNIHVAVHYHDYCRQYATIWNTNVLIGEQYHRLFKRQVTHTNHKDVELHLLRHDGRKKTVRFVLEGAFEESNPEISRAFADLKKVCPTLIEYLLPASSHQYLECNGSYVFRLGDELR
ncbi:uncharacterized protein H6S33_010130 [Morchella sextelata]|uniref:uncharacterized protein n=1 Tax=Morchella sextelata TaxID=1174677 RepID=UPI001D0362A9|nr:uncharacterized protein H6S33_010130 [Morchella sextelata]KAH0612078.1 hypothetical protein H6S33_010130 [Morchella sextelata]